MKEIRKSICRFCHASCAIEVEIENGKPVKVIGDKNNPIYHGFSCIKGRSLPDQHLPDNRLLHSMKRMPSGEYRPIPVSQAMDEIAEKTKEYEDRFPNPFVAASKGFIDEVIYPHSTRRRIALGLRKLRGKVLENPWKKHDNTPL